MTHPITPNQSITPKLVAATVAAIALLVSVVLPAEYGVDPTGVGKLTGISALADNSTNPAGKDFGQKLSFNVEEYDLKADKIERSIQGLLNLQDKPFKSEKILLEIEDMAEIEHKFIMEKDTTLLYSWKILNPKGEGVFFEFHGHPSSADAPNFPKGFEQAYSKGEGTQQSGSFTAPFSGYHGWFIMNLEEGPIQIELTVSGYYKEHKEMHRAIDGEVVTKVEF